MRILMTGATGYIGSYLTRFLSENTSNNEIILLVKRLPDHFNDWSSNYLVIESDIMDLDKLLKKKIDPIDCLIHLASYNDVDSSKNPDQALMINGIGTRNVLETARNANCKSFIYFSTLQVYGKELQGNYSVETPTNCLDDYALTHLVGEKYCRMFSSRYGLNISVVRPSNIFGCPVHYKVDRRTLVPTALCLSAYKEKKIVLRSSGKQNRDFVSLDYVSNCIKHLIENRRIGYNVFNITSENLFSILEVSKMVQSRGSEILNTDINLICESTQPINSNQFLVKNNLLTPPSRDEVREDLYSEIGKIFKMLIEYGGH